MKLILKIFSLLVLVAIFSVPVMAEEKITQMSDLPLITREEQKVKAFSVKDNDRIVILYNEKSNNNIGKLDLDIKDFTAGKVVDELTDLLEVDPNSDTDSLIEEIKNDPNVAAVDYEITAVVTAVPNDRYYKDQKNYALVEADKTWNDVGENEVKVAVLDSGVSMHEDLVDRIAQGYDIINDTTNVTDLRGHGTMVAGVIAANTNNAIGIAGISGTSNVKIVPFTVLNESGLGESSDIIKAINMIIDRGDIRVLNMSFGMEKNSETLRLAVQRAAEANIIMVGASGNKGVSSVAYPAQYSDVLAVGSVDNDLTRSKKWQNGNGSNYGFQLDIMAPGTEILTTYPDNSYVLADGTSLSCPTVTGAVALLLSHDPNLNFDQVYTLLTATARDLGNPGFDIEYGYGLLQINKALQNIENIDSLNPNKPNDPEDGTLNDSGVAVFRLYNEFTGEHLYTCSEYEVLAAVALMEGWHFEGIGWYAPTDGTPVYRLYNQSLGNHLFTLDKNEIEVLSNYGWVVENNGEPLFYSGGQTPIYRLYNQGLNGLHLLTTDLNEYNVLPAYGWNQEDIGFYALKVGN